MLSRTLEMTPKIWTLFFFVVLAINTQTGESNEIRYCFGTNNELSLQENRDIHYTKLKERYTNCTVVRGNLEITGIDSSDVDFLKDIEAVTGYVIIALNSWSYFPLEKLKIIRGQELYQQQYALYIAVNYRDTEIIPNGLRELRMKSLTEIQRGSVLLKQNMRLCFAETINWLDIINSGARKRNKWNVTIDVDRPDFDINQECGQCDPSCEHGCWGKGPDMCQTITHNCSSKCGDARCRGPLPEDCCDRECAAGCTGPTDRDCIVCLHVNNSGVCQTSCPPKTLYDQLEARVVPNPDFKYHYHDQCVDKCPINLLVEENMCVKSCRPGQTDDGNGFCVPCNDFCDKECYGVGNKDGPLGFAETVNSKNIDHFQNCTIIRGNVVFQAYAFEGDEHKNVGPLSAERLIEAFRNVKVITGYLEILSWPKQLRDFSVFANLEEIQGVDLFRDIVALVIQDSINDQGPYHLDHVESLGFNSLRSIKHGNVYMGYLKKLCFAKTVNWKKIIEHPMPYKTFQDHGTLFRFLPSERQCGKCSSTCSSHGCWGSSEFDCLSCKNFTYGKECLSSCTKERGVYADRSDMTCKECHPECNGTCIGPGEANCTSCKHFREDGLCVIMCSVEKYADKTTSVCLPCNPVCHRIGEPDGSPLCSGPLNTLGNGGCESCHTVVVDSNLHVQHCINNATDCPEGHFLSEGVSQSIRSCVPCYKGCRKCTGARHKDCLHKIAVDRTWVVALVVTVIVIIVIVIILVFGIRKRQRALKKRRQHSMRALGLDTPACEPMTPSGVPPNQAQLRIMKDAELHIGKILGSGAFGTVHKGYWIPSLAGREKVKVPVAIKVLRDDSSHVASTEILDEAFLMASCEHPNLVRLLGISLSQKITLITQLMPLGNLLEYVRDNKDNIGSQHLLNWCLQIAQGMHYLSKEKHLVHRDLAARNVLVKSPNHVRITDFGLAKLLDVNEDVYRAEGGKMPIKWLALESIQRREFTHKSDVWSFGVTVWELMTFGKKPYENVPAREVHTLLERGERLLQPTICTIDVYMIMIKCWTVDIDARPTFQELVSEFTKMARDPSRYLVVQHDGNLSELPSPTTSEFLRKMSEEEGDDFNLRDAEEYLNPTTDDNANPHYPNHARFPLQPAPVKAQWRRNLNQLPYGRLNTTSTTNSSIADSRLDSALTNMTGLPSVSETIYPNGASTPYPSVSGASNPGIPNVNSLVVPSLTNSQQNRGYCIDQGPGTSGLTNHLNSRPSGRTHSDSSDVFVSTPHARKVASLESPWEPMNQSQQPIHPGVMRAREDSATQRYSAEPILCRQQSRPNDSEPEGDITVLTQDENGYLEPTVAANKKPEYLDPSAFPPSPYSIEGGKFFPNRSSDREDTIFVDNPEYEPTFSPPQEQIRNRQSIKHSNADDDGYEIPMSNESGHFSSEHVPNEVCYQNLNQSQSSTLERRESQSGASSSSEKRDSGMQSEGDDEQPKNFQGTHAGTTAFGEVNPNIGSHSLAGVPLNHQSSVENPNYELLENVTTNPVQHNISMSDADERTDDVEYVNELSNFIPRSDNNNSNESGQKTKNPMKLTIDCPLSEEEDNIFITPEAIRRNVQSNGKDGLTNGINRTYSEPDSGVGIEMAVDNLLYHKIGSAGWEDIES